MHTSRTLHRLAAAVALVVVANAGSKPTRAAGAPCQFNNVDRIVAVGDVHGAYDRFVEILRVANVIDERLRWIGGRTHLVQLGDVVDRGPDSLKALDLLDGLQREAQRAGGAVHQLLGNHEVMRMLGDLRYTVPGEYAAFTSSKSTEVRDAYVERAKAAGDPVATPPPLGSVERRIVQAGAVGIAGRVTLSSRSTASCLSTAASVRPSPSSRATSSTRPCAGILEAISSRLSASRWRSWRRVSTARCGTGALRKNPMRLRRRSMIFSPAKEPVQSSSAIRWRRTDACACASAAR
jgi:hypothetical protein